MQSTLECNLTILLFVLPRLVCKSFDILSQHGLLDLILLRFDQLTIKSLSFRLGMISCGIICFNRF
jgi:hypothetical protein